MLIYYYWRVVNSDIVISENNIPDSLDSFQQNLERCMDASDEIVFMLEKLNGVNGVHKVPELEAKKGHVEKARAPVKVMFLETQIDEIANLLEKSGGISLEELTRSLGLKEECASRWCQMLERRGVISIDYPVFGKPVIKLAKNGRETKHAGTGNGHAAMRTSSVLPESGRMLI